MASRNTYKYHLKRGNKIIRSGITNDLDRREDEHQREYGEGVHVKRWGELQHEKVPRTGKKSRSTALLRY